mgnify:CR=1 FL=1
MIKVSAPEGAFSIVFEFKGYDIIFFSVPDTDTEMMCDMRVFKDGKDVSSEFTEILSRIPESQYAPYGTNRLV